APERPVVAREVRGHPVENHAETRLVTRVDEEPEVVRVAEARRRRVVAGHLIAPRALEWMLHHRHELDVREPEPPYVLREPRRDLAIGERTVALLRHARPRSQVPLVDRHRLAPPVARRPRLHPRAVAPRVAARRDDARRRARRTLEGVRDGIA